MGIKKFRIVIPALLLPVLAFNINFALWNHNAEIRFRITITQPAPSYYDTIAGGIQYNINIYESIKRDILSFKQQLMERIDEINELPFGCITQAELSQECLYYRNEVIAGFGERINGFGQAINELTDFYRNSSQEEKDEVPDFWEQHQALWDYFEILWSLRDELYSLVDEFEEAGQGKIYYD